MMTWARVDLPDPFGPMTAWTWPLVTSRSTPRRISLPSTPARSPETTRELIGPPSSPVAPLSGALCCLIRSPAARSCLAHGDEQVAVLDPDVVDGHRQGGGEGLGLAGGQREGAPVLPAFDLPL